MADLGIGLAALAFWGFVAACVIAGVWNGIRKRDAQHETIRRMIESGQPINEELLTKLSLAGDSENKRHDRDFYVTGLWLLPTSVGLAIFGIFIGVLAADARMPLFGAAALVACLGVGSLIAAKLTRAWYVQDDD